MLGPEFLLNSEDLSVFFYCSYGLDELNINEKDAATTLLHYEYGEPLHYRGNCTNPGYVVFTVSISVRCYYFNLMLYLCSVKEYSMVT